ncbi:MAG: DNA repair protein RadA, partial [Actinomycetota bacterium]
MSKPSMVCLQCGHRSLQWLGRCPDCSAWDSFAQEVPSASGNLKRPPARGGTTLLIGAVDPEPRQRIGTGL